MNSIFNHNLIYLAIFDNIYVLCTILECIRKYFLATQFQTVRLRIDWDPIYISVRNRISGEKRDWTYLFSQTFEMKIL